jgi:hypothetical protein
MGQLATALRPAGKTMDNVIWYIQEVSFLDFLPHGATSNVHSGSLGFWTLSIVRNSKY